MMKMKPSDRLRLYAKYKRLIEEYYRKPNPYGFHPKEADYVSRLFMDQIDGWMPLFGCYYPNPNEPDDELRISTLAHFRVAKSLGIGE